MSVRACFAFTQARSAGGGRAGKRQKAAPVESDSDGAEQKSLGNGASLEGVLQHMVQGLNSQDGDR